MTDRYRVTLDATQGLQLLERQPLLKQAATNAVRSGEGAVIFVRRGTLPFLRGLSPLNALFPTDYSGAHSGDLEKYRHVFMKPDLVGVMARHEPPGFTWLTIAAFVTGDFIASARVDLSLAEPITPELMDVESAVFGELIFRPLPKSYGCLSRLCQWIAWTMNRSAQ